MSVLGIRREDKSEWERRVPLVPSDVKRLVAEGVEVHVQRSPQRCIPEAEYEAAGAKIVDTLDAATVVLGVKEMPASEFRAGVSYMFFSHTIKGQPYNMAMLRTLLEREATLYDYELVTDDAGVRTIAFGRFAGLAGGLDTLWALGRRFAEEGIDTPLGPLRQSLDYVDLEDAKQHVDAAAARIAQDGWPAAAGPLVIAVTGYGGKVAGGAWEVLERLPHRVVAPADLPKLEEWPTHEAVLVPFGTTDLVRHRTEGSPVDKREYYDHPERYEPVVGESLPYLTALVHGILWTDRYPKFITREDTAALLDAGPTRFRLITDITCDPDGSNELLPKATSVGDPTYVIDPRTGETRGGFSGDGIVILGVDILPAELPRDASRHFSAALTPLVPALMRGIPSLDDPSVAPELRRAVIALRGELVPPWDDNLAEPLAESAGESV